MSPNNGMQRTALRAAADAERYAKQLTLLQNIMTSLNKTYLLTFYLLLFIIQFPSYLNSTSQSPDTLFFNGRKYALYGHPLDILIEKDASFKDKLNKALIRYWKDSSRSDNYRGYDAGYEIINNRLFLTKLEMAAMLVDPENIYSQLFPMSTLKAECTWFSGILALVDMDFINHMGNEKDKPVYTIIAIDIGKVVGIKQMNNVEYTAFRDRQFKEFIKSKRYRRMVNEIKKEEPAISIIEIVGMIKEYGIHDYSICMMKEIVGIFDKIESKRN